MLKLPADPATRDLARLYYTPTRPVGADYLYEVGEGKPLDVDSLLSVAPAAQQAPIVVDLAALRGRVKSLAEGRPLIQRVLDGEPLAEEGERDSSLQSVMSVLAFSLPDGTPGEAAIELVRDSIHKMPCNPEGFDWWMNEALNKYTRAAGRRVEAEARRAAEDDDLRKRLRGLVTLKDGEDWRSLLLLKKTGEAKNCTHNAAMILRYADEVRGTLRYDLLRGQVLVVGGPLAVYSPAVLATGTRAWLESAHQIAISEHDVRTVLLMVARESPWDPVREYLESLKWDGKPRLDTWLRDYMGADDISYHTLVGARWMISAVARARRPGCQVDTVLVLEGEQGIGKSSAFRILGGDWHRETSVVAGNKDSRMEAVRTWLVELAELASIRKVEAESIKSFITACVDSFRPPYGAVVEDYPRRCVFVGTTNDDEYLGDATGNRRFLPVKCGVVDRAALARDRDQLWAEADNRYKAGEPWWLEGAGAEVAADVVEERVADDQAPVVQVWAWWSGLQPERRPEFITTAEVGAALACPPDRLTRGYQMQVGRALRKLGFKKDRRRVAGAIIRGYLSSTDLRATPYVRPLGTIGR